MAREDRDRAASDQNVRDFVFASLDRTADNGSTPRDEPHQSGSWIGSRSEEKPIDPAYAHVTIRAEDRAEVEPDEHDDGTASEEDGRHVRNRRHFQFTLRSLMLVLTAFAILLGLAVTFPKAAMVVLVVFALLFARPILHLLIARSR